LRLFHIVSRHGRAQRMARCVQLLGIGPETRVLDVGGTLDIWLLAPLMPRLVMLNNQPAAPGAPAPDLLADGRSLPFRDASFDVVFSNSVIEHLGDAQSQVRFAAEVARVGNAYWVQTPNRLFPVEQHLFMPFLHWLPGSWQRRLLEWGSVWEWIFRPTPAQRDYLLRHYLTGTRLLTAGGLAILFPGARILKERFLGWTKSLVAFRPRV
jgi:SAM-dependent methyltransferase